MKLVALIAATTLVLAACGSSEEGTDGITVVATTSIWGDVVAEIVGNDADVVVLIPRGTDAHDYQPSPQQVADLAEADLVVANGLGLEEGFHDIFESARADGANILEIGPELDPIPFEEHDHDEEDHEHGGLDPHVWFDPLRVATAADLIADRLTAIDPSIDWAGRANEYTDDLVDVDEALAGMFSQILAGDRKLVTNHEALGYLADRYDFEIVGVVIPGGSTLGDPSSAELAELVHTISDEGVAAIFTETTEPSSLAEAVAAELEREIAIVELYTESLGEPGTVADTLIGLLEEDARRITEALG